eukprot:1725001-Karenia_brevis.AAC.1
MLAECYALAEAIRKLANRLTGAVRLKKCRVTKATNANEGKACWMIASPGTVNDSWEECMAKLSESMEDGITPYPFDMKQLETIAHVMQCQPVVSLESLKQSAPGLCPCKPREYMDALVQWLPVLIFTDGAKGLVMTADALEGDCCDTFLRIVGGLGEEVEGVGGNKPGKTGRKRVEEEYGASLVQSVSDYVDAHGQSTAGGDKRLSTSREILGAPLRHVAKACSLKGMPANHSTIAKIMGGPRNNSLGYRKLVDARPATHKRTIKKFHHRAVWSSVQVRYKEDFLAYLATQGVPVQAAAVDDKAKTPLWIPVS